MGWTRSHKGYIVSRNREIEQYSVEVFLIGGRSVGSIRLTKTIDDYPNNRWKWTITKPFNGEIENEHPFATQAEAIDSALECLVQKLEEKRPKS